MHDGDIEGDGDEVAWACQRYGGSGVLIHQVWQQQGARYPVHCCSSQVGQVACALLQ